MLIQLALAYSDALNTGKVPTIDTAWNYVQGEELQRTFTEVIKNQTDLLMDEFQELPVNEEELIESIRHHKQTAMAAFKDNLMGGSELFNSPKGIEYQEKIKHELSQVANHIKEKNRAALRKGVNEQIQQAVDTEVKPKIEENNQAL